MPNFAFLIARKDLRIALGRGCGLVQALLLGLLLIFVFSISKGTGETCSPLEAATIFWLSSVFCQILVFSQLYSIEETNLARHGLLLLANHPQSIWLGKTLAALPLLCLAQAIFLPATIIFLGQNISGPVWPGLAASVAADIGMCALGSLLGAVGQGNGGRDSLLSIIMFPLLVPVLLGAISLCGLTLGSDSGIDQKQWLGLICAFDAIFIGVGLLLFGFVYQGDD